MIGYLVLRRIEKRFVGEYNLPYLLVKLGEVFSGLVVDLETDFLNPKSGFRQLPKATICCWELNDPEPLQLITQGLIRTVEVPDELGRQILEFRLAKDRMERKALAFFQENDLPLPTALLPDDTKTPDSSVVCHCPCHSESAWGKARKHVVPCCIYCEFCGQNIRVSSWGIHRQACTVESWRSRAPKASDRVGRSGVILTGLGEVPIKTPYHGAGDGGGVTIADVPIGTLTGVLEKLSADHRRRLEEASLKDSGAPAFPQADESSPHDKPC